MTTTPKYALRHKASGKFMPASSSGKGYSFWNPDSVRISGGMENAIPGSVRLFETSKGADNSRVLWARGEADYNQYGAGTPDYEDRLSFKDVGRKKDMLEVVPMTLAEQQPQLDLLAVDYAALEVRATAQLVENAARYTKLRDMHWADGPRTLCVVEASSLSLGTQTYCGSMLDEVLDSRVSNRPVVKNPLFAAPYGNETEVVELRLPKHIAQLAEALGPDRVAQVLQYAAVPFLNKTPKGDLS